MAGKFQSHFLIFICRNRKVLIQPLQLLIHWENYNRPPNWFLLICYPFSNSTSRKGSVFVTLPTTFAFEFRKYRFHEYLSPFHGNIHNPTLRRQFHYSFLNNQIILLSLFHSFFATKSFQCALPRLVINPCVGICIFHNKMQFRL